MASNQGSGRQRSSRQGSTSRSRSISKTRVAKTTNIRKSTSAKSSTTSVGGRKSVTRKSSASSDASANLNGSRFQALSKTCNKCNQVCTHNSQGLNVECVKCKIWQHPQCLQTDPKILEELCHRKSYLCDDCKNDDDSGTSEMEADESSISMTAEDRLRAQFDVELALETPPLPEGNTCQKVDETFDQNISNKNGAQNKLPVSSTPKKASTSESSQVVKNSSKPSATGNLDKTKTAKEEPLNPIERKLDEVKNMIVDLKNDIQRTDTKVKIIDAQQESYLNATTFKLKENVHKAVGEAFGKIEDRMVKKLENTVDKKVNQIEKNIDLKVINVVNKMIDQQVVRDVEKKLEAKIDKSIKDKIDEGFDGKLNQMIEQKVEAKMKEKVERMIDTKMEVKLDAFSEQLWRRKNVIIVNLPECNKINIEEKKQEDLNRVDELFNKIMNFDSNQIDGLPVRVGKIQEDRPRMLRVTMKSERTVNEVVYRAQAKSDILNPGEKDKRKKIYVNKDFTFEDRQIRKELFNEIRNRVSKNSNEKGKWIVRKNKIVEKRDWQYRPYQNRHAQDRRGQYDYQNDQRHGDDPDEEDYWSNQDPEDYSDRDDRENDRNYGFGGISPMNREDRGSDHNYNGINQRLRDQNEMRTSRNDQFDEYRGSERGSMREESWDRNEFRSREFDRSRGNDRGDWTERGRGQDRGRGHIRGRAQGTGRRQDRGRGQDRDRRQNRSRDRSDAFRNEQNDHYRLPHPLVDYQHQSLRDDRMQTRKNTKERGGYRNMHYGRGYGGAQGRH